mmetsp:Transcript_8497/g.13036  ORF Transcript_8497/g.13036 Transcript_8497/m.13036 type:complete len:127 (-) Transcript_8497:8048-8428(-)
MLRIANKAARFRALQITHKVLQPSVQAATIATKGTKNNNIHSTFYGKQARRFSKKDESDQEVALEEAAQEAAQQHVQEVAEEAAEEADYEVAHEETSTREAIQREMRGSGEVFDETNEQHLADAFT